MSMFVLFTSQAFAEDIIWQEDFSGFTESIKVDPNGLNPNYTFTGTTFKDDGSYKGGTAFYDEALAGGTAPELLVAKGGGSFAAKVALNGKSGDMMLAFKSNRNLTVTVEGATLGEKENTGNDYLYPVTVTAGTSEIIITFTNSLSQNGRMDNIKLYQGTAKKPAGLSWGKGSTTLTIGQEVTLTLSNENNLPVTYTSSDETVATISSEGIITLIAAGKTTITAEFAGNDEYEAQSVSIEVTVKEEGGDTPDPGTVTDVTVAEALAVIDGLEDGKKTTNEYKVTGYVVEVVEISTEHGNATFTMADAQGGSPVLTYFRGKGFNGENITDAELVKVGDKVEVQGLLQKYAKDGVITPEVAQGGKIISINGETGTEIPPVQLTGNGTLENPYTAADANIVAGQLASGQTSTESYYIKGKIASIKYEFTADHGTAHFYISDDGQDANTFFVYSTLYLGNRQWVEGDTQIKVGDDVIIYGQVANYQGTLETASRKSYIYSLNGVTDGGQVTPVEPTKVGSIAELLEMGDTNNVELTLTDAKVLFNDGNSIYVRENGAAICFSVDAVKTLFKDNAVVSGTICADYLVDKLLPKLKSNAYSNANGLTVTESEEEAVPVQTTLTRVDEGEHACDLITLTAQLVRKVTVNDKGTSSTEYYLEDEEAEVKVANNGKNLKTLADEAEETGTPKIITVVGIVNSYNNAYQIKLTKNAEDAAAGIPGDVNADGTVDVADISAIISVMAGTAQYPAADVNSDGTVDVADISNVITIMAEN